MRVRQLGGYLIVVAAAMILATTYLAIFFAPLPQTSVESASEAMSSIEGSRIQVAGFVSVVRGISGYEQPGQPFSVESISFSLADFSDYSRFLASTPDELITEEWWTVRPIDVSVYADSPAKREVLTQLSYELEAGTNLSVDAEVVAGAIGPDSKVTGSHLLVDSAYNVVIGLGPGSFETMSAPIAQKIFYFHMPSAWVSYLAFFVTLVASVLYLKAREPRFDRLAHSSAELGVLFATIAISTGPIWAKQEWGVYWRWDDTKLVTTFVLWLVYIGYLSLRAAMADPGVRARVSAVYGILGFVTVPMSLLSSRIAPLLRSSHPKVIASSSGGLSPEAGITIGIAVIAFSLLFVAMLIKRVEIAESEEEIEELKRIVGGEE